MTNTKQEGFTDFFKNHTNVDVRRAALVLIDMQKASASRRHGVGAYLKSKGCEHIGDWRFTRLETLAVPNLVRLLNFFRSNGLHVVHVGVGSGCEDYSDMPPYARGQAMAIGNHFGSEVNEFLPELMPLDTETVVRKTTASAFMSSDIDERLRDLDVEFLYFGGVSTNICVDGTARDAADRGYACTLVKDACAGVNKELHRGALANFECMSGRVLSTDNVFRELRAGLGHDA